MRHWYVISALALPLSLSACETYVAPPTPTIVGVSDNVLDDANAPLVIHFDKPVRPQTLKLAVAPFVVDDHGRLPDEIAPIDHSDPTTPAWDPLLGAEYTHTPSSAPGVFDDFGGAGTLSADGMDFTITPTATFPIGPRLVVVIEPGLSSLDGVDTHVRRKLQFGYRVKLDCHAPSKVLQSGPYFILMNVKTPIAVQVQLWTYLQIAADGSFIGQFTKGRRNPDPSRCTPACSSTEACRTLPKSSAGCVIPSERAGDVDEFPDWIPNTNVATGGFSFTARGCIIDQPDGSATFENLPADIVVQSPQVTLRAARLTMRFTKPGVADPRATGSATADDVILGTSESGSAEGDLMARYVSQDLAPANVPKPPAP